MHNAFHSAAFAALETEEAVVLSVVLSVVLAVVLADVAPFPVAASPVPLAGALPLRLRLSIAKFPSIRLAVDRRTLPRFA